MIRTRTELRITASVPLTHDDAIRTIQRHGIAAAIEYAIIPVVKVRTVTIEETAVPIHDRNLIATTIISQ